VKMSGNVIKQAGQWSALSAEWLAQVFRFPIRTVLRTFHHGVVRMLYVESRHTTRKEHRKRNSDDVSFI
jgi:hypothetical protein